VGWVLLAVVWLLSACSDSPTGCTGPDCDPVVAVVFPPVLSQLDPFSAGSNLYAPQYLLWSNGLVKERRLSLPSGAAVNTDVRSTWVFPDGTRLFKTFSVTSEEAPTGKRPVETRVMVKREGNWEFGVYLWRADGSDAELLDGRVPVPVPLVDAQGRSFIHQVPSLPQCNLCHLTNSTMVIGFSELQLNAPLTGEGGQTQLEAFFQTGVLSGSMPPDPEAVSGIDDLTRDLIGYFEGNCAFCHNQKTLAGSLDLSHKVFLENTVNQPSQTGGFLIRPQDPDGSVFFQRFTSGQMPALGVQMGDSAAYLQLQEWILTHDFGG